jgi:hypothetical protein
MWYAVISEDTEDRRAGRKEARPAHVARLKEMLDAGRLYIADTYISAGDHDRVIVNPFKLVLP